MANAVIFIMVKLVAFVCFNSYSASVQCVPPSPTSAVTDMLQGEFATLKNTMRILSDQWEKWNTLFLTSLEPRITSTASTLASIDSNIHNLQERAHVWDTFQLHVAAWNDQLASLDRKMDIISKGQEKLLGLDGKINAILSVEYKLDDGLKILNDVHDSLSNMDAKKKYDSLLGEFATRGVLSSIKTVEKKLDRLLLMIAGQLRTDDAKPKSTIKCNGPRIVEDLLNDISSKVDVIFDTVSNNNNNISADDDDDAEEDYVQGRDRRSRKAPFKQADRASLEEILNRAIRIENASLILLDKEATHFERLTELSRSSNLNMGTYFDEQRSHFENALNRRCAFNETPSVMPPPTTRQPTWIPIADQHKSSCEDLQAGYTSGVYIFRNEMLFNKRYCEYRDDGSWTVVQRRDDYAPQHNFNASWREYKYGFGDLHADFWMGNDFLSVASKASNLKLRIELEDFEGNAVWAEYDTFSIGAETSNYRLSVAGYKGNASDSFSGHDGFSFSTYDRTNDAAPECCPCAVSYGGGWWFSKCFESNLNGIYYKKPQDNDYFRGVIWERWLGDYSLKRSVMMVKPNGPPRLENSSTSSEISTTETIPYYEDP